MARRRALGLREGNERRDPDRKHGKPCRPSATADKKRDRDRGKNSTTDHDPHSPANFALLFAVEVCDRRLTRRGRLRGVAVDVHVDCPKHIVDRVICLLRARVQRQKGIPEHLSLGLSL